MKGLEISVVALSKINAVTPTFRYDPEYFQQEYLRDEAHIQKNADSFRSFADLGIRVDASAFYPAIEDFYDSGELPFLRVADVDSVIDFQSCTKIPAQLCERFPTLSRVQPGDTVFTKGGSVARIGLVTQNAAVSRDLIFLNSSVLSREDQLFLYCYFQTSFFNRLLLRSSSQTAQPHLTITLVRDLLTFIPSANLKNACAGAVTKALTLRETSITTLAAAEEMLLRALGLEKWRPPEPLAYARSSADVFAAGRFDAAYFSPAKTSAFASLLTAAAQPLGTYFQAVRDLVDPLGGASLLNFDVGAASFPVIDDATSSVAEFDSAKKAMQPGDVVISRLRHYLRQIAVVRTSPERQAVGSSEFIVLHPSRTQLPPEALVLFLRSPVVQTILEYSQDGSQHPRFGDEVILNLPVPPALFAISTQLVAAVRSAHAARREAQSLLAKAQRAVEIAIEESEAAALAFLRR